MNAPSLPDAARPARDGCLWTLWRLLPDVLHIVGAFAVLFGLGMIHPGLGWIGWGVYTLCLGWLIELRKGGSRE